MIFNGKFYSNLQFTSIGENKECGWIHYCLRISVNAMFTKMSARKVIKSFKERAVAAVVNKYTQLENTDVVGTENPNVLTPEQKRNSLRGVNLIKDKR